MSNLPKALTIGGSFAAGMALMYGIDRANPPAPTASADPAASAGSVVEAPRAPNPGAVPIELWVMSQCPYGLQAEAMFKEVVDKFGADVDLKLEFIGDAGPGGALSSMHGPKEVAGNVAQACAMKYVPKWLDFVLCQNEDNRNVDTNWKGCATKVGASSDALAKCIEGDEGKQLVAASFQRAQQKNVSGSPTIFLAGKPYEGGRRPVDIMRAVCAASGEKKPEACSSIPEPIVVNVTLVGDRRCTEKDCDLNGLERGLKERIPGAVFKKLDASSPEGKKLLGDLKLEHVPAVVFDSTLDADAEGKQAIERAVKKVDGYYVAELSPFQPACADDGGCKLDACKESKQCLPETPGKLEVFVMSQCPYGVRGVDALKPFLAHFDEAGDKLDLQIHFIGDGTASSLSSMHGPPEVEEDLREICAIEHYGTKRKYLDYFWCRSPNITKGDWASCATKGIDEKVIRKCSEGDEGRKLLAASFAYAKKNEVQGSPTWRANGKFEFQGIDPQALYVNFCAHNAELKGCKKPMAGVSEGAMRPGGVQAAPPSGGDDASCGDGGAPKAPDAAPGCGG